jgi:hypothetical protein
VHQLAGVEVEVCAVELVALGVVGYAHAEVAELVDGCRSLFETSKRVLGAVDFFGLVGRLVFSGRGSDPRLAGHSRS